MDFEFPFLALSFDTDISSCTLEDCIGISLDQVKQKIDDWASLDKATAGRKFVVPESQLIFRQIVKAKKSGIAVQKVGQKFCRCISARLVQPEFFFRRVRRAEIARRLKVLAAGRAAYG